MTKHRETQEIGTLNVLEALKYCYLNHIFWKELNVRELKAEICAESLK